MIDPVAELDKKFGRTVKQQDVIDPVTALDKKFGRVKVAPEPEQPDRGVIADTAVNVARGAADTAELTGYALKTAGAEKVGQFMVDKAQQVNESDWLKQDRGEITGEDGYVKTGIMSGFRSAVPSLTAGLGGAAAGAGIGSVVPGVGTVAGGLVGGTLGALGLFGAGIYGKGKQRALDAGVEEPLARRHGFEQGLVEGGIEAVSTPIELMLMMATGVSSKVATQPLKQSIKQFLKTPAKQMLKNYGKTIGVETSTEMLQSGLSNELSAKYGLSEGSTKDAVIDSIIPAVTMSLLFGVGAHAMDANRKRILKNTISSPDSSPQERVRAANQVWSEISKQDKELANKWRESAFEAIKDGRQIDIDDDVAEFAAARQATEAGRPPVKVGLDAIDQDIEPAFKPAEKPGIKVGLDAIADVDTGIIQPNVEGDINGEGITGREGSISGIADSGLQGDRATSENGIGADAGSGDDVQGAGDNAQGVDDNQLQHVIRPDTGVMGAAGEVEKSLRYNQYRNTQQQRGQFIGTTGPATVDANIPSLRQLQEQNDFDQAYNQRIPEVDYISDDEAKTFEQRVRSQQITKQIAEAEKAYHQNRQKDVEIISDAKIPKEIHESSKQQVEQIISADPVYNQLAEARKRGGINLKELNGSYDAATVKQIMRRHPGTFSNNGIVKPDELASEYGYESLDDMVNTFSEAKTKTELRASITRELADEWKNAETQRRADVDKTGRKTWAGVSKRPELPKIKTTYPASEEDVAQTIRVIRRDGKDLDWNVIDHWSFSPEQRKRLAAEMRVAKGERDEILGVAGQDRGDGTVVRQIPEREGNKTDVGNGMGVVQIASRERTDNSFNKRGPSSGIGDRSSNTGTMRDKAGTEYADVPVFTTMESENDTRAGSRTSQDSGAGSIVESGEGTNKARTSAGDMPKIRGRRVRVQGDDVQQLETKPGISAGDVVADKSQSAQPIVNQRDTGDGVKREPWEMTRKEFVAAIKDPANKDANIVHERGKRILSVVFGNAMYNRRWAGLKDQVNGKFTRPTDDVLGDLHKSLVENHLKSIEMWETDQINPYAPKGLKNKKRPNNVPDGVLSDYPDLQKATDTVTERGQEKTDPRAEYDRAIEELDKFTPSILDDKNLVASPNVVLMNVRSLDGNNPTKIAAPYDGTKKDAQRVAKLLGLYASENYDASGMDSETFATDGDSKPVLAFSGDGYQVEEINETHIKRGDVRVDDTVYYTDISNPEKRLPGNFRGFDGQGNVVIVPERGIQMALPAERVFKNDVSPSKQGGDIKWVRPNRKQLEEEWKTETLDTMFFSGYPKKGQSEKYMDHFIDNLEAFSSIETVSEKDLPRQLYVTESVDKLAENIKHMNKNVSAISEMIKDAETPMPIVLRKADGSMKILGGRTRASLAIMAGKEVKAVVVDEKKMRDSFYPIRKKEFLDDGYGFTSFEDKSVLPQIIDYIEGKRTDLPPMKFDGNASENSYNALVRHLGIMNAAPPPQQLPQGKEGGNEKSTGHITFANDQEYYTVENGDIHRAPITAPIGSNGRRSGRFESTQAAKPALMKMLGITSNNTPSASDASAPQGVPNSQEKSNTEEREGLRAKEVGKAYSGFTFSENDIPYERARLAHYSTSFSPDRRGKQEQEGYASHMKVVIDSLSKYAKTDEQKQELQGWFNDYYRPKYVKLKMAQLDAQSRTMSSMITGPSNFPVARNQRRLDTERRRSEELSEFHNRAVKKMRSKLQGSEAISSTDPDAVSKLKSKLDNLEKSHAAMVAANKVIRNKKLDNDQKIAALVETGLSKAMAEEVMKPDFMGRIGFAQYQLQNSNANIKTVKDRIAGLEKRAEKAEATGGSEEFTFDGGKVELNHEDGYLRIYHDEKPSAESRASLKSSGFRWTPSEGVWRRKLTSDAKYAATRAVGVKFSKTPTPTGTTPSKLTPSQRLAYNRLISGGKVKEVTEAEALGIIDSYTNSKMSIGDRTEWADDFPEAIIMSPQGTTQRHKDYLAAKRDGDVEAAFRVVRDVVSKDKIAEIGKLAKEKAVTIVVPVVSEEKHGKNKLPRAFADFLAAEIGVKADVSIIHVNKVERGGSGGFHRLAMQPEFSGPVEEGKEYIIVDDTLAQGGTLAALKGHIETFGGKVIAASALTGKEYSAKFAPDKRLIAKLRDKYPSLEKFWNETFGYGFDKLTNSEANYLLTVKGQDAKSIRDRISAIRQSESPQTDAGIDSRGEENRPASPEIKYSSDGSVQGFILPDGTVYVIPENIERGRLWPVLLHEVGTHASKLLHSEKSFKNLLKSIESRKNEDSVTGKAIRAAMERVPDDTKPEYRLEEIAAYLIESAPQIGIARRAIMAIKRVLVRLGFDPKIFTAADFAAMADVAVRRTANVSVNATDGARQGRNNNGRNVGEVQENGAGEKGNTPDIDTGDQQKTVSREAIARMFKSVSTPFRKVTKEIVESAPFKAWFNKSITSNPKTNQPFVFYHNSPTKFYKFDLGKLGSNTGHGSSGLGFFFGVKPNPRYGAERMKVFLRLEKPYRMTLEESQQFETVADATKYREKLQSQGYDGIIMDFSSVGGNPYIVVFTPNQVKSAEVNTGEFSRGNDDIRHSKKYAAAEATFQKDTQENVGKFYEKIHDKPDMPILSKILSTPEYFFKQFPATWKMFNAQLDRHTEKFNLENDMLGDFVQVLDKAQKSSPEAYQKAKDHLIDTDKTGKSYRMKHEQKWEVRDDDGMIVGYTMTKRAGEEIARENASKTGKHIKDYTPEKIDVWTVIDPKGQESDQFLDEQEAVEAMEQFEHSDLINAGWSKEEAGLVKRFRRMTNTVFDHMIADLRKILAETTALDLPEPTMDVPDESRRWGVYENGHEIAAFATEADAMAAIAIKKKGMEVVKQKDRASYEAKEKPDKDIMKTVKLSEMIAMMSDLRGQYFPRQRKPGGVILRAVKGDDKIMEKFDLYITGRNIIDTETGAISQRPMSEWLRKKFNKATGFIPFADTLEKRARQLRAQGYDIVIEKDTKTPESVFDVVHLSASVDALLREAAGNAKKKQGMNEAALVEINKILTSNVADLFKARGYLSSRLRRSPDYWKGFEEDPLLAGTQYARGIAAGIAKRDSAKKMMAAMTGRDQSWAEWKVENPEGEWEEYDAIVEKNRLDPKQQPTLHKEALGFMEEVLRNDEQIDRVLGTIKGLAVMKFLGLRVSSALVNLTNMVMAVPATISSMSGRSMTSAFNAIRKASAQYAKYRSGKGELSDADRAIFLEITNNGWDQALFNQENASVLMSKLGRGWAKFGEMAMYMFGAAEKANRSMTIFAAYKELRANSALTHDEAMKKAKHVSDRAHGIYGKETLPTWARGSANPLKLTYTFQKFAHNYMLNMAEMGLKGDKKQFAYMLLSPALMGGAGATLVTPILAAIARGLGAGDDPEEEFYAWAEETFGSDSIARHGIPGALGINLKGSIEMNNPIPTTMAELFGAPQALFSDTMKAVEYARKGEAMKAGEALLPTAIGSAIKAVREGQEGLTTGSYSPVFYGDEPLKSTGTEQFIRALSFNPSRISGIREKQWHEKEVAAKYNKKRARIIEGFKRYYLYGSGDYQELMREFHHYNELVRGSGRKDIVRLTRQSIKRAVQRARRPNKTERMRDE